MKIKELLEEVATKNLLYYGFDIQSDKVVEESSELITAMMHYKFERCGRTKVLEEIADIYIVCEQIVLYLGAELFEEILAEKLMQRKVFLESLIGSRKNEAQVENILVIGHINNCKCGGKCRDTIKD